MATMPRRSNHFSYMPLDKDHIRVIELERSTNFNAPLRCRVRHIPFLKNGKLIGDQRPYQVLSYSWGESGFTHSLKAYYLEDQTTGDVPIYANLDLALRKVREDYEFSIDFALEGEGSYPCTALWVDAICINQDNDAERGHGVKLMSDIYASASRLTIWLGEFRHQEDDLAAFRLLDDVIDAQPQDHPVSKSCSEPARNDSLTAVKTLLNARWFKRRWVLQETLKAPLNGIVVLFGSHSIPYKDFVFALDYLGLLQQAGVLAHDHRLHPSRKPGSGGEVELSLLKNLQRYDGFKCREQLDLIYAILSFSDDQVLRSDPVIADYTVSCEVLFMQLAERYLTPRFIVPLLVCASTRLMHRESGWMRKHQLPSWVPDWRIPITYRSTIHHASAHWSNVHFCSTWKPCDNIGGHLPRGETHGSNMWCPDRVSWDSNLESENDFPCVSADCLHVPGMLLIPCTLGISRNTLVSKHSQGPLKVCCDYHLVRSLESKHDATIPRLARDEAILLFRSITTVGDNGSPYTLYHPTGFVLQTKDGEASRQYSVFELLYCFTTRFCISTSTLPYQETIVDIC